MTPHFTFFESYYTSVKDLDSEIKAEFYEVIFEYALYDKEPTDSTNNVVKALFKMAKPNLDSSKAKRNAGKQGGSKTKQAESKTEANLSKPKQVPSDKEKEKEKESNKAKAFIPPTMQEIIEYQKDKCNLVDAKYFYEFFTSNNWVDSNGKKVLSWKQKMITWQKSESNRPINNTSNKRNSEDFLI